MKNPVILIGIGEIGGVFARGVLKAGYSVVPVLRGVDLSQVASENPNPKAVMAAVGERDIQNVLSVIPPYWTDKLILLQNELLPRDWQVHNIKNPTVISVWFEKKAGQDVKEIIPSPVYGPLSKFIESSLKTINISSNVLSSSSDLQFELVLKNLYILTVNIAGLIVGGTVGELWGKHRELARDIASDVLDIQFKLINLELNREALINGMINAFNGDLEHKCMGRSAPTRLVRAITLADEFKLEIKKLREIHEQTSNVAAAHKQS